MASRRSFIKGLCAIPVLQSLPLCGEQTRYRNTKTSIDVIRMVNGRRHILQSLPSENPVYFSYDSTKRLLLAVNEISEYQGLPTGSVESYSAHPDTGYLTLVSRRPLSLSATMPRRFAVSPDFRHIVVAVYGGGAYNVLPISPEGELGPVSQIIKETGSGPDPQKQASAHPHSLIFHPSGRFVLTTDLGTDRVNVFGFSNGLMKRVTYVQVPAGSGPAQLGASWPASKVYVTHGLRPGFSGYQFDDITGRLTKSGLL
jgi:6-phosphogluconolactonase (cycloisomerase 2 family)